MFRFPASAYSAGHGLLRRRYDWRRRTVPLYGSFGSNIPSSRVIVPASIRFAWDNPDELYPHLPQFKFAPARAVHRYSAAGLPQPAWEMQVSWPPTSGGTRPPEWQRRRHDSKVPGFYNRLLALISQTYGRLSEFGDLSSAILQNLGSPLAIASAVALEHAVDVAYGSRARFLKEHIYGRYYHLPVGIDTLSRLWR